MNERESLLEPANLLLNGCECQAMFFQLVELRRGETILYYHAFSFVVDEYESYHPCLFDFSEEVRTLTIIEALGRVAR